MQIALLRRDIDSLGVAGLERELAERVTGLERELADTRVCLAERYIRRDDWVPTTSRVIGLLEEHGRMLARLDERTDAGDISRRASRC